MTGLDRVSTDADWEPELSRGDWADREAKAIADDAEAFNRTYPTISTEQADDLARAYRAIGAALGRIEN